MNQTMPAEEVKSNEHRFLKRFLVGRDIPSLSNRQDQKTFEDFQRYDLIRIGPAGKLRITERGKYALGVGVKRYIANVRLEKKLFKDFLKSRSQNRWLLMAGLLIVLLLLSVSVFYSDMFLA